MGTALIIVSVLGLVVLIGFLAVISSNRGRGGGPGR